MRSGTLVGTHQCDTTSCKNIPNYLIWDPADSLLPFCQKEYGTCQNNEQIVFNNVLRAARYPIECAFGHPKARWLILTRKIDLKTATVPTVVYAWLVLYNFAEKKLIAQLIKLAKESARECNKVSDPVYSCDNGEGEAVHNLLTQYIKLNLPDNLVNRLCKTLLFPASCAVFLSSLFL